MCLLDFLKCEIQKNFQFACNKTKTKIDDIVEQGNTVLVNESRQVSFYSKI